MSILHTLKRKLRSCRRQQDGVLPKNISVPQDTVTLSDTLQVLYKKLDTQLRELRDINR